MPPPPVKLPTAPVAPTVVNTFSPPGVVGQLMADFDRDGSEPQDTEEPVRLIRPGAIILANLDINDMSRLGATPPADLATVLDGLDHQINGAADELQLTLIQFDQSSTVPSKADRAVLRITTEDSARIHVFGFDFTNLLAGSQFLLGDGAPNATDLLVLGSSIVIPMNLEVEALTLAGDPGKPGPTGATPGKPVPFKAKLPPGSTGSPVYKKRAPGEVWMELVHQNSAGADLKSPRDVAVFTIAPWLLLSNIQPPRRVYAVYLPPKSLGPHAPPIPSDNHNFAYDVAEALQSVFTGIVLPADTSTPLTASTPASTLPLYLIDGNKFGGDPWAQDEMEIGYCWAPQAWMHVVLHCRRGRELKDFVHEELVGPSVGLFDALHSSPHESIDYGGNLEVSPAIDTATSALSAGAAGPAVPAHRKAPFGKIILGDSKDRPVNSDFRKFLFAQRVQPVLPLDTSWLQVGHVDEFTSFVPANTAKGWKMLFGSVLAMTVLLEETKKVPVANGRTNFHRGKWFLDLPWQVRDQYDEISVEDLLTNVKPFNDKLRAAKLIPLDQRVKAGLHLVEDDIVRVPTYFEPPVPVVSPLSDPRNRTVAKTVGMVNLLVTGNHLIVPKPYGARVKEADAKAVLTRAFKRLGIKDPVVTASTGDLFWVAPGESPENLACYFAEPPTAADRQNIIDHLKNSSVALNADNALLIVAKAAEIAADPRNAALAPQLIPAISSGTFANWFRAFIPQDTVDLVESFMLSVCQPLGLTLHFVDDWFYHANLGEVHCGTNAMREPPELTAALRWWDHWDPDHTNEYSV